MPSNTPMARKSGPRNFDNSEMDRTVSIMEMTNNPTPQGYGVAGE
jgi:hypothetical protein